MSPQASRYLTLALKAGVYALFAIVLLTFLPSLLLPVMGYLATAALGTFAAAAIANALALRIYEQKTLASIGLFWNPASRRNLSVGLLGGIGAALAVLLLPVIARASDLEPVPNEHFRWPSLLFVSIILLFGAIGEEMLFRGYAFQILLGPVGPFATILPVAVLFGFAHLNNQNVTTVGIANTMLWGVLFGYAFLLSGDLWLPIGLHFGWNWTLPLLGVNLSGFTMNVTGYAMHWRIGVLWSGGAYGPEGGLLGTIVLIVLFFCLRKAPILRQSPPLVKGLSTYGFPG